MEWKSIRKLVANGVLVLRRDDDIQPKIVRANEKGYWVIVEKFNSTAERDKALENMLDEGELTILDE